MGSWDERHDMELEPRRDEDVPDTWPDDVHRHLVLLANLTEPELVSELAAIAKRLGEFDCIAPVPPSFLHVTVKVAGNVVDEPADENELPPDRQDDLVAAIPEMFTDVDPFEVSFPRLDLWPTVVYAAVTDGGRLADLNDRACELPGTHEFWRDRDGFVPHATLGEFRSDAEYADLFAYLEANRSLDVPAFTVDELELVAIESGGRHPDWRTLRTIELG